MINLMINNIVKQYYNVSPMQTYIHIFLFSNHFLIYYFINNF